MKMQNIYALTVVELKKLYRDPMPLSVLLLMPVGLSIVYYLALSGVANANDYTRSLAWIISNICSREPWVMPSST